MDSIDVLKLHSYLLEKFNIYKIPLCAIEAIKNSPYKDKIDELIKEIDDNINSLKEILKNKYDEDDNLKSYAIVRLSIDKVKTIMSD